LAIDRYSRIVNDGDDVTHHEKTVRLWLWPNWIW